MGTKRTLGALVGVALAAAMSRPAAAAEEKDAARPADKDQEHGRRWIAALGVGSNVIASSDHQDTLAEEGYSYYRWHLAADVAWRLHEHFAVGGWTAYAFRSDAPAEGGPDLSEHAVFVGGQAPLLVQDGQFVFGVHPQWGVVVATQSLYGTLAEMAGPAVGGTLSFRWLRAHVGGSLGYVWAPVQPPSDLALPYDVGGFLVHFEGVIDG